jgi:hypothetical protein
MREPIGKRLRFEILKRDGFKCRYCGVNAVSSLLQVDHVVPVVEGGSSVHENLVTACVDCNSGKSCVPLDESQLDPPAPTDDMLEHAEQIRAYLEASKEVQRAKEELAQYVCNYWCERMFTKGMPTTLFHDVPATVAAIGLERTLKAIDSLARNAQRLQLSQVNSVRYFRAIIRSMREEGES